MYYNESTQKIEYVDSTKATTFKTDSKGYITIKGGHRVGIVGSAVIDNDQIININYI